MEEAEARNRKMERSAGIRHLIREGAILEGVFPDAEFMEWENPQAFLEQELSRNNPWMQG